MLNIWYDYNDVYRLPLFNYKLKLSTIALECLPEWPLYDFTSKISSSLPKTLALLWPQYYNSFNSTYIVFIMTNTENLMIYLPVFHTKTTTHWDFELVGGDDSIQGEGSRANQDILGQLLVSVPHLNHQGDPVNTRNQHT